MVKVDDRQTCRPEALALRQEASSRRATPEPANRIPDGVGSSRRRPFVRLNGAWCLFTQPKRDLILLGTVQCGQEIGALARTPQGCYIQINGGVIRELNRSRIQAALDRATRDLSRRLAREAERLAQEPTQQAPAPRLIEPAAIAPPA